MEREGYPFEGTGLPVQRGSENRAEAPSEAPEGDAETSGDSRRGAMYEDMPRGPSLTDRERTEKWPLG